jgi:hypothetical protein
MWIIVLRKGTSAGLNTATKVGINELRRSEITSLNDGLPTLWGLDAPKNHTREARQEVTLDEARLLECGVCKSAILKPTIEEIACQICVAPVEPAMGENAPFKPRVGIDVEVKEFAIVPTAISKTCSIKYCAVVNRSRRRRTSSNEQLPILYDFLPYPGECSWHGAVDGLTVCFGGSAAGKDEVVRV